MSDKIKQFNTNSDLISNESIANKMVQEPFSRTENFEWRLLKNREITVSVRLAGGAAAIATNYGVFFINPYPNATILSARCVYGTAGTDGGTVTSTVEKLTGTQASTGGTSLLPTPFNLKSSINTVQVGVLSTIIGDLELNQNDRLGITVTGTPTSVDDLVITVTIKI